MPNSPTANQRAYKLGKHFAKRELNGNGWDGKRMSRSSRLGIAQLLETDRSSCDPARALDSDRNNLPRTPDITVFRFTGSSDRHQRKKVASAD